MKAMLLGVLVAVVVSFGATAGVSAAPAQTNVTGVVTDNHVPVAGAMVTVLCEGNTETDTTDAHGSYLVSFLKDQCPFGSTVKVTGQKGGESGVASGTVRGVTTKLNLAIVNVAIPEFGVVGALAATGAGVGLIAFARRRRPTEPQVA